MLLQRRPLLTGFGLALVSLGCSDALEPVEPGAPAPDFKLPDFQPKSARFGETYGLDEFRGSVLVVPLYAGWCDTCIGCCSILNDVLKEWQADGLNVRVAAINPINALPHQKYLVEVCEFPLLQDTEKARAWDALLGSRDDTYFYDPHGVLSKFIDFKGNLAEMIVSDAGKALFRQAVVDAGG